MAPTMVKIVEGVVMVVRADGLQEVAQLVRDNGKRGSEVKLLQHGAHVLQQRVALLCPNINTNIHSPHIKPSSVTPANTHTRVTHTSTHPRPHIHTPTPSTQHSATDLDERVVVPAVQLATTGNVEGGGVGRGGDAGLVHRHLSHQQAGVETG